MSLSSILQRSSIKSIFRERIIRPPVYLSKTLLAPPLGRLPHRIGTAFDYAMRYGFMARGWGTMGQIVADNALQAPTRGLLDKQTRKKVQNSLQEAKAVLSCMEPIVELSIESARSCLELADIDLIYRIGHVDDIGLGAQHDEIVDLQSLFRIIPWDKFRPTRRMFLNPSFGEGSHRVGGADADVIIDHRVIDIKVIRDLKIRSEFINQVVGYALLANTFGIENDPPSTDCQEIVRVEIYLARSAELIGFDLNAIAQPDHHSALLQSLLEPARSSDMFQLMRPVMPSKATISSKMEYQSASAMVESATAKFQESLRSRVNLGEMSEDTLKQAVERYRAAMLAHHLSR